MAGDDVKEGRGCEMMVGAGAAILVAVLVAGCEVSRPVREVGVTLPTDFSGAGSRGVGSRWWREFGDGELNRLEERALAGNFDLRSAEERLRQAEAVVRRARSGLGPYVEGSVDGTVFEFGDGRSVGGLDLGLGASYEVDLWGRIRAGVAAEELRARATGEDYRAAAISLSAEVATTWYGLVEAREQVELIRGQVETNGQVVRSLENRFVEGQGRAVDILRQRQLLESTRESLTVAELSVEVLENRLAVLLGRAPGTGGVPDGGVLPKLPGLPATGLPVGLLERRPDVRAAFARIHVADAEVAVAMTERYPRLTLGGSSAGSGKSPSALFSDWVTAIGFEVVGPIFDAGERQAEVERTEAVLREAIADYRQVVVEAIGEVENALARERKQVERIESLRKQVAMAERSSKQLQREFLNANRSYIEVLTALDDEQDLRRRLLVARRELLEYRVALYRALAGGFEMGRSGRW